MGDDHQGLAPLAHEAEEELDDALARFRVEISRRFVGEDDARVIDQRPGDGHALLLAAGELGGEMLHAIREPDIAQGPLRRFALQLPPDHRGQHGVLQRRQFRQQEVALKNEADALVANARLHALATVVKVRAFKFHGARFRRLQTREGVKQGRLARARGATEKGRFALLDVHADPTQDLDLALAELEGAAQVASDELRGG